MYTYWEKISRIRLQGVGIIQVIKKSLAWIAILAVVSLGTVNGFAKETIRLSAGHWPPYTGEHLEHHGIAAHIVSEAFAMEGIGVEFQFFPWKRAFVSAKRGEVHGSILWRRIAEREKSFYYCDSVITINVVFFHLKAYPFQWDTMDDLKGIRIGVVRGFNYSDALAKEIASGRLLVDQAVTQEQNFKKLMAERIQITPVVLDSGYATIRNLYPPDQAALITHHPTHLATQDLHLILTKSIENNKRLQQLFNRGLSRLRESGRLDALGKLP